MAGWKQFDIDVPTPDRFLYEVGQTLEVMVMEGDSVGRSGVVMRRCWLVESVMPAPKPTNYYWLRLEGYNLDTGWAERYLRRH